MKRYDSYKPSGIEWIGEIPSHWEVKRGKYLFQILSGYPFDSKKFSYEEGTPLIRIRDIDNGTTEVLFNGKFPKEYVIKTGDILIGMDGDFNISSWKGNDALLNQRVCKLQYIIRYIPRYAYYVLPRKLKVINDVTYATTVKHLSVNDIYESFLPVPPASEQDAIASYLDKKCGEIDRSIAKQQRRIELLEELKQSVITQAVTRGLDSNVPLRDSGIEWIGEIPKHWECAPLKRFLGTPTNPCVEKFDYVGR